MKKRISNLIPAELENDNRVVEDSVLIPADKQLRFDLSNVYNDGSYAYFDTGDDALNLRYHSTVQNDTVTNSTTTQFQPGAIYIYGEQVLEIMANNPTAVITKQFLDNNLNNLQVAVQNNLNSAINQLSSNITQDIQNKRQIDLNYVDANYQRKTFYSTAANFTGSFTSTAGYGIVIEKGLYFKSSDRIRLSGINGYVDGTVNYYDKNNGQLYIDFDQVVTLNSPSYIFILIGGDQRMTTYFASTAYRGILKTDTPAQAIGYLEAGLKGFTAAYYKNLVTSATADKWVNGELQTAINGSFLGMKFCDANYFYEYTYSYADTNGTNLKWIRLVKGVATS